MMEYLCYSVVIEGIREVSFYVYDMNDRSNKYEKACEYANRRIDEGVSHVVLEIDRR